MIVEHAKRKTNAKFLEYNVFSIPDCRLPAFL